MSNLPDTMRGLARLLRVKRAAEQAAPKPIPNPVASRARGDLGSSFPPVPKEKSISTPDPFQMLKGLGPDVLGTGNTGSESPVRA